MFQVDKKKKSLGGYWLAWTAYVEYFVRYYEKYV